MFVLMEVLSNKTNLQKTNSGSVKTFPYERWRKALLTDPSPYTHYCLCSLYFVNTLVKVTKVIHRGMHRRKLSCYREGYI
jgi:hypothetical protein